MKINGTYFVDYSISIASVFIILSEAKFTRLLSSQIRFSGDSKMDFICMKLYELRIRYAF